MKTNDSLMIIAHRGAAGEAPENTLAAFKLGLEQGCTGIELDVHLSKDGEVIVCHDGTLDRTTDSKGVIRDMTVDELKKADAGRWFHEKYAGERVPLLEEVLDLVSPEVQINVEIKGSYGGETEPALLKLLHRKNRLDSVFVSSFDFVSLELLKSLEPNIRIGQLYSIGIAKHYRMADLIDQPLYSLHPQWSKLTGEAVREAKERGLAVYPWTVNAEETMRQMIEFGVSGIITDYPGRLKKLLEG
ncbi:glycerophosphodiester phosphodiesterase [Paenibacillus flagellatus]|uniref:Glycerophosphodiester phosphodiesterase n=1 Tax=Paenibacillus flagellatus TaxID=2211139 RepID=A0A2V5KG95_9BACL|nr:glycerophosphodiester phosphodiesterase [Paenibacillus flagellatus]PYI57303.1 glycerophosphodiester phosphodiesterase [Paenibacillus flagellatus]